MARQQDVLYNLYRGGYLDKSQYESYKSYDITKDFKAGEKSDAVSHDYLYYSVMSEAQDVMYDYLVKRDKVSSQDLKMIRQRKAIVRGPFKSSKPVAIALRQPLIMQFIMRCKMLRVNMVASSTKVAIVELKSGMCSWIMRLEQF